MKKSTAILTLAIGIGILFSSNLKANNNTSFDEAIKTDISIEKEIVMQDWMLEFDAAEMTKENSTENEINLELWMITPEWVDNSEQMTSETEIELEDWMTRSFLEENIVVAQFVPVM